MSILFPSLSGSGSSRRSKKKKSKTAVVEVQDGAHLKIEAQQEVQVKTSVQSALPIVGAQDGQVRHTEQKFFFGVVE